MIRRYDVTTYTAVRIEAMRVSTAVFDDDADPGNPRRDARRSAGPDPADAPTLARRGAPDWTIDRRDGS